MKRISSVLVLVVIAGCVPHVETVNLVDGASTVKVFRKTDPPASCQEIRPFSVVSGNGCGTLGNPGNYGAVYNSFKNMVVSLGGNAGLLESEVPPKPVPGCWVNEYVMNGVAYKCPDDVIGK